MNIVHETVLLEGRTSGGLPKYWQGFVTQDGDRAATFTKSYSQLADGSTSKVLQSTPKTINGKNIGRSNATTPHQQAVLEIEANAMRKVDSGYRMPGQPLVERLPLPMLAHSYDKRGHNIEWNKGVYVQPKLDGTRMLFDGAKGWSRKGKIYISDVLEHLKCALPDGFILDGELMLDHRKYSFQESIRAIKKFRPDVTPELEFHVYDLLLEGYSFKDRWRFINDARPILDQIPGIRLVESMMITEQLLEHCHSRYVREGYEGIMIRNAGGHYKVGHRSADLQKLKLFHDDEFEIVAVGEGAGKDEGTAVFTCITSTGLQFNVRPRGTTEERAAYYDDRASLIGKRLTVRYQEMTDANIPRFPIGITIRDYE